MVSSPAPASVFSVEYVVPIVGVIEGTVVTEDGIVKFGGSGEKVTRE